MDASMRLESVDVKNLFNLFDHEVALNLKERITIIHAPNGYGKTVLLKLIAAALSPNFSALREFEFSSLSLHFDEGARLHITQRKRAARSVSRQRGADGQISLEFTFTRKGEKELQWTSASDEQERSFPISMIDELIPSLDRVGPRAWRVSETSETLSLEEVFARYEGFLPTGARRPPPEWLREFRNALPVRLIETQRLLARQQPREGRPQRDFTPVVQNYADELRTLIRTLLAQSATSSQALDRTFPSRLLAQLDKEPATEQQIRARLADLEAARTRLMNAGLLAKGEDDAFISGQTFEESTRQVLTVYVQDAHEKLVVFNTLLEKIELFKEIINSRFTFKSIRVDADKGFAIDDMNGRELRPSSLSSGEQHELVLVYELLFKTSVNSLILIDEPEISFHIAWQRNFLKDLTRLIELAQLDVVLATHSPQLIGARLDLTVPLKGPRGS